VIQCFSPNWNERPPGCDIDLVVLHYTGMQTGDEALARLCDPEAEVSAHYMIEEDGTVFQLVPEEKRAWHAGVSSWCGRDNINHYSIGIELVNPGHEFGYRAFPDRQIDSLLEVLAGIKSRHFIPCNGYIGHSDIAPDRKTDPGELFPWHILSKEGFGVCADTEGHSQTVLLRDGESGAEFEKLNMDLAMLGYSIPSEEAVGPATHALISAFQSHWRQSRVTGYYDVGTAAVLSDLVEKMQEIRNLR